jgi:uncharacterized protein
MSRRRGGRRVVGRRMVSSRQGSDAQKVPCLYEVSIRHSRQAPLHNSFHHRSYMWLFELDEPPRLPAPLRPFARYRPQDHIDVRASLREAGMEAGRILVLTNLRVLSYVFNPISIYWCYDDAGVLTAHVAEVHNTHGGRHAYVLPVDADSVGPDAGSAVRKAMSVSPFYPVDGAYRIRIGPPNEKLSVSVVLDRGDEKPFRAYLSGTRRDATVAAVLGNLFRYPAAPLRGRALIQLEGLRLWRRRLEVQPR